MSQDSIRRVIFEWATNKAAANDTREEIQKLETAFRKSVEGLGELNNFQLEHLRVEFANSSEAVAALNAQMEKRSGLLSANGAAIGFERELATIQAQEAESQRQQTAEMVAQLPLHQRLAEAAERRKNAEDGFIAGLRDEANATPAAGGDEGGNESGGGKSGITGARSSLRALGFLLGPELGGPVARAAGQVITLTATLGAAGAGIGIVIAILHALQEQNEAGKKAIQDETAALKEEIDQRGKLRQAISGGSTGAISQQVADLQAQREDAIKLTQDRLTELTAKAGELRGEGRNPFEQVDILDKTFSPELAGQVEQLQKDSLAAEDSVNQLNKQIDDLQKQGKEGAGIIQSINKALSDAQERRKLERSSDVDSAKQQIADFTQDLAANGRQVAETEAAIADARKQGKDAEAQALEVYKQTLITQGEQVQSNLDLYRSTLPIIEANKALKEAQDAALRRANTVASAELEADNLTSDQRVKRVAELNREIEVYQQAAQKSGLSAEAVQDFADKIAELGSERDVIGSVAESLADIEAASEALKKQNDELFEAEKDLGDSTDKLNKAEQELQDTRDEHAANLDKIQDEQTAKETAAQEKRDKDLGDARTKSARKLASDLAEIDDASDKRIAELKRTNTRQIEKLVAQNDQAAAIEALEDQAFQISEENRKRKESEDKRKEAIDSALEDQEKTIRDRYDEQVTAAQDAADKAVIAENDRFKKEETTRQRAYDQALVDQQNAANQVLTIQKALAAQGLFQEEYYANGRLQIVDTNLQRISDLFNSRLAALGSGLSGGSNLQAQTLRQSLNSFAVTGSSSGKANVQSALDAFYAAYGKGTSGGGRAVATAFDNEGVVTSPGLAWLGVIGERYSLPAAGKAPLPSGGDAPVNIHVYPSSGMDEEKLARLVVEQIDRKTPAIVNAASTKMAQDYERIRRR